MRIVFIVLMAYATIGFVSTGKISAAVNDSLFVKGDSAQIGLTPKTNTSFALNRINFDDSLQTIYNQIGLAEYDLSYEIFRYAMTGYYAMKQEGKLNDRNLLTIIDFTKSSNQRRFYTIDLDKNALKFFTYTSHGKNTGDVRAAQFSNRVNSNQSSLGFYITGETYIGSKGFSLKLDGQDGNYNDKMRERGVVIHSADYVSESWIKRYGRLGRSFGCPALSKDLFREVIDVIKNKTLVFAYYNDQQYLNSSSHLNTESLFQKWEGQQQMEALLSIVQVIN